MADDSSTNNNDEVFIYKNRLYVPNDAVRVRVHPSVTRIIFHAFSWRLKLEEVELCDGLLEIGEKAFFQCRSLKNMIIPATVVRIGERAFQYASLPIKHPPDSVESIGQFVFANNNKITNFRIPPSISTIRQGTFSGCKGMFSLELPETVTSIEKCAFSNSLRNIALGDNYYDVTGEDHPFLISLDLKQLFVSESQMIYALKHRFDDLPIHKMIYYQSYNNMTLDQLNKATDTRISRRRSKVNPSGSQQDCLGMTPLHIMACSTLQNIELYRVLVEKYPETLITKDRWGASPLFYTIWGRAPDEIIQYLVESYKSIYPDYELNWTKMMKTLSVTEAPMRVIQCLIDLQEESFPSQFIKWEEVLDNLRWTCSVTFWFLVKCSISKRVNGIGLKKYRDSIMKKVESFTRREAHVAKLKRREFLAELRTVLRQYETKFQNLKEATSVLELVLWKNSINETMSDDGRESRKRKFDEPDSRKQYRVSCGADIIIRNVLPYLLPS